MGITLTKEITLNVERENNRTIFAKQGDFATRFVICKLVDGLNNTVKIEQENIAVISAERENGETNAFDCEILEDGKIKAPLTSWMLSEEGELECEIAVYTVEEERLASAIFKVNVQRAVYLGENIPDDNKYLLVSLIADVIQAKQSAQAVATLAESWAVGGTDTREGEDTNNSKYFSLQSKDFSENAKLSEIISSQAMADLLAMLGTDIATLTDGKLTPSQIPDLSINDVFTISEESELVTLDAQRGDCAIVVADNIVTDSYILATDNPAELSNWKKLGVSYVANAGHATTSDTADNATKINNKRIIGMTQTQYESAVLADDTFYFVTPDEV